MVIAFRSKIIFWHGPSPFIFAQTPIKESELIRKIARDISYGWGCIPVYVKIAKTEWKTSLIPKEGKYLVPIKKIIQEKENVEVGKIINIELNFIMNV